MENIKPTNKETKTIYSKDQLKKRFKDRSIIYDIDKETKKVFSKYQAQKTHLIAFRLQNEFYDIFEGLAVQMYNGELDPVNRLMYNLAIRFISPYLIKSLAKKRFIKNHKSNINEIKNLIKKLQSNAQKLDKADVDMRETNLMELKKLKQSQKKQSREIDKAIEKFNKIIKDMENLKNK